MKRKFATISKHGIVTDTWSDELTAGAHSFLTGDRVVRISAEKSRLTKEMKVLKEELKDREEAKSKGWKTYLGEGLMLQILRIKNDISTNAYTKKQLDSL